SRDSALRSGPFGSGLPVLVARPRPGARRVLRCPLAAGDARVVFGVAPLPTVAADPARHPAHPGKGFDGSLPRTRPDDGAAPTCRTGSTLVQRRLFRRHGASLRVDHGLVSGATLARHGHDPDRVPLGAGRLPLRPGALHRPGRCPAASMTEPDVTLTDVGLAIECGIFALLIARRWPPAMPLSLWFAVFFASIGVAALAGAAVHGRFLPDSTSTQWLVPLVALGVTALATEMITEIYVPRAALPRFVDDVRTAFGEHRASVVYGTIRLIERDDESFLAWAGQSWACVIFNLHVVHTAEGIARATDAFRR